MNTHHTCSLDIKNHSSLGGIFFVILNLNQICLGVLFFGILNLNLSLTVLDIVMHFRPEPAGIAAAARRGTHVLPRRRRSTTTSLSVIWLCFILIKRSSSSIHSAYIIIQYRLFRSFLPPSMLLLCICHVILIVTVKYA